MQTNKYSVGILSIIFLTFSIYAVPVTNPTSSGPITLDSDNFANVVVDGSLSSTSATFGPGSVFTTGPFVVVAAEPFVIGSDLSIGLALGQGPAGGTGDFIVPGFGLASIVNGPGADLIVWEAGTPAESFLLSVSLDGGTSFSANISYNTSPVVPAASTPPFAINSVSVDLTDFGVSASQQVDAVRLEGLFTGIGDSGPDILAVAAINAGAPTGNIPGGGGAAVPEPSTYAMMALGLISLGIARRRKTINT